MVSLLICNGAVDLVAVRAVSVTTGTTTSDPNEVVIGTSEITEPIFVRDFVKNRDLFADLVDYDG